MFFNGIANAAYFLEERKALERVLYKYSNGLKSNHHGNVNQNYHEISPHTNHNG